jgi:hypothetical protein
MDIKDLAGLSEPASKLIDAFVKGASVLYAPHRIRNEAKAEADALLIATGAELQADDLRRRAVDRFISEMLQKQQNLEAILGRATGLLTSLSPTTAMDSDWVKRFALEAQDVSDEDLHGYWARLLAGEFQSPGKFPRRLLRLLKDLDPKDARMIESVAPRVLQVETHDKTVFSFLPSRIVECWTLGPDTDQQELADGSIPETAMLRELGIVDQDSFLFEISVEGSLRPDKIQISRYSALKIYSASERLVPQQIQPNFLRTKGPAVTRDGRPQINVSTKAITFNGWRVTQLGESMFSLAAKPADSAHLAWVRERLVDAGLVLSEK